MKRIQKIIIIEKIQLLNNLFFALSHVKHKRNHFSNKICILLVKKLPSKCRVVILNAWLQILELGQYSIHIYEFSKCEQKGLANEFFLFFGGDKSDAFQCKRQLWPHFKTSSIASTCLYESKRLVWSFHRFQCDQLDHCSSTTNESWT